MPLSDNTVDIEATCSTDAGSVKFSWCLNLGDPNQASAIVGALREAANEAARQFGRTDLLQQASCPSA